MNVLLRGHSPETEVAFDARGQRVTCAELCARVAALANELPSGSPERTVVLMCNDRLHFATGLLAALSRGLTVALPPNGQAETVHQLAARLNAVALLHDRDDGRGLDVRTITASGHDVVKPVIAEDARVVLFTSGSTGEPSGHEKRLSQLLHEANALIEAFALQGRRVARAAASHLWATVRTRRPARCEGQLFARGGSSSK